MPPADRRPLRRFIIILFYKMFDTTPKSYRALNRSSATTIVEHSSANVQLYFIILRLVTTCLCASNSRKRSVLLPYKS